MEIISFSIMWCMFAVFLMLNRKGSKLFGIFASLILIVLGLLTLTQDFMLPAGFQTTWSDDGLTQNISNIYVSASTYFPTVNPFAVMGFIVMMIGVWMLITNALTLKAVREKE